MAVSLRFMKLGKKGRPFYRIIALDKRKKRNGSYIEKIGHYDPMTEPETIKLDKERFDYWISKGAEISDGLRKILKKVKKD